MVVIGKKFNPIILDQGPKYIFAIQLKIHYTYLFYQKYGNKKIKTFFMIILLTGWWREPEEINGYGSIWRIPI
jgi:hypothetical protein